MKKKNLYSPEIDEIIQHFSSGRFATSSYDQRSFESETIAQILNPFFNIIQQIEPERDSKDNIWTLWLRSERGPLSVYCSHEEYQELKEAGEIQSTEELEELWRSEYPDEIKWHKTSYVQYEKQLFVNFDSKLQLKFDLETQEISGVSFREEELSKFFSWLVSNVEDEINKILLNPAAYNQFIAENLPLQKRVGKIKRIHLWENVEDITRLDEKLGKANLESFEKIVNSIDENALLKEMTADDYFRYCEICYDANNYFKSSENLTPREKYKRTADGREGGLLEIAGDSFEVFSDWYIGGTWIGGHPWEICRGGNTTHISLSVHKDQKGWKHYLAGSSWVRVVETAKMAIALFDNKIPFTIIQAQEMLRMLKGIDYLGIVPDDVTPKYCHSLFQKEDQIIDFINPWIDEEIAKVIKKFAEWYPVDINEPKL